MAAWRLLIVAAISGLALTASLPSFALAAQPACRSSEGTAQPASFTLVEGQGTEIPLGRRERAEVELEFNVAGCRFAQETPLTVVPRLFRKDAATLDRKSVDVTASARGDEAVVTLTLRRDNAEPGRYLGAFALEPDYKLGQRVRVPLTVTVQYRDMKRLAWSVFPLTILLGTLIIFLKGLAAGGADSFLRSFNWKGLALDAIAVGAGTVAALGAWRSGYLNNEIWGSGDPFWDGVDLLIVMVAAFIAAATVASIPTDAARQRIATSGTGE